MLAVAIGCAEQPFEAFDTDVPEAVVLTGDDIEGVVGRTVEEITVRLIDDEGRPVPGLTVRFQPAEGAGETSPSVAATGDDGIATSEWVLGTVAGEQRVELQLARSGLRLAEVVAEAHPAPPHEVAVSPEAVTLQPGIPVPLEAQVRDMYGNSIAVVPALWSSADESIAQVDSDGVVVGLAFGSTQIEAALDPDGEGASYYDQLQGAAGDAPLGHHRPGHTSGNGSVEVVGGEGDYVSIASGDGQVGPEGELLPEALRVRVTDAEGRPLRKVRVEWRVTDGGGSVSSRFTDTDGRGRVSVRWTLGMAGTNRVTASAGALGEVVFTATAVAVAGQDDGADTGLDEGSGDDVSGDDGSADDGSSDTETADPARVEDLRVVGSSEGSITLRFTEVDDGVGEPANYEVRFAPHPIGWGWGTATKPSAGSCAGEILGGAVGATLTCTVEGLDPSDDLDFQLISYRGLIADGSRTYGDLSNVATGRTDDPIVEEEPLSDDSSGGGSTAGYPNEPSGYTLIASSPMDDLYPWGPAAVDGSYGSWWQYREGDPDSSIGNGSNVPGGPYYNRTRYKAGQSPGTAPVNWGGWDPGSAEAGTEHERIYFSQRLRLVDVGSGNWQSHEVGTKLGFWAAGRCSGALNEIYAFLEGGTRSEFTLRMLQQSVTSRAMGQNRKSGAVMRVGQWHHWEIEMILNDIGHKNGILRWWVDGELIMEHTDVEYRTSSNPCGFRAYKWNPTWGGMGGSEKSRDDFIDISDIRISGKPLR